MYYIKPFFTYISESTNDVEDYRKSYFMTLDEYRKLVSPLLKEFKKFINKNISYFNKKEFSGLIYLTYPEYVEYEIDKLIRGKFNLLANKEYVTKKWLERNKTIGEIPTDIHNQYLSYIESLKVFFGDDISKVEDDELNSNKRSIRRAIDSDIYISAMLDNIITPIEVVEIIESVGLKVPKRVIDMKYKVEQEGYNRSLEDSLLEKDSKFTESIVKLLKEEKVIKNIEDRKRKEILNISEDYEKSEIKDVYEYIRKLKSSNPTIREVLPKLYNKKDKVDNYNNIVDTIVNNYVNGVISKFAYRLNKKLAVINNKLGLPDIKMGSFYVSSDIEGDIDIIWSNKYELKLNTKIILAGGTYHQVLHERYLFNFFRNGKKINIEEIDQV